jgi:hypothetical protein
VDFLIRSNTRIAIVVILLAATLGSAIAMLSQNLPTGAVTHVALLAFVTLLACAIPLARRVAAGTFDIFEPIVFACAMLAVLCGIRPIITSVTGDYVLNERYNAEPFFAKSVALGAIATITFILAYELIGVSGRDARPARTESLTKLDPRMAIAYAAAISMLGLMLYSVYVRLAGGLGALLAQRSKQLIQSVGNASEYLSAAPVALACAATLIVIVYRGALSTSQKLCVTALAVVPAGLFAMLGNRRFIIPCLLLPLFVGYLASGNRPRTIRVAILVPMAFLILATIPFARSEGARNAAGGIAPIYREAFSKPGETANRFFNGPDTDMLLYLGLQINFQDDTSSFYRGDATIGDLLIAPIPSSIYPAKPVTARNDILTRIFGQPCSNVGGTCPDFSVIGTFYQDFAIPGVIIGMALLGAGASGLWRRFKRNPSSPYLMLAVGVVTIYLPIVIRAGMMPATSWALYFLIPTAIGIRISRRAPMRRAKRVDRPAVAGGSHITLVRS